MSMNVSPDNTRLITSRVAAAAASTWNDMSIEDATSLVEVALSDWAAYTGESHYRYVMTSAMRRVDQDLSEYVADDIVDRIENEQAAIRTAERLGL